MTEARILEEEVRDTTAVMRWMDEFRGWLDGRCIGKIHNAVKVLMMAFPYKIHYMHQVDDRKMEHAAKTR